MSGEGPVPGALPARIEAVLLDAGGVLLDLDYGYLRRLIEPHHRAVAEVDLARAEAHSRKEINAAVRDGGRFSETWRDYFHIILAAVGVEAYLHDAIIDSLWEAHRAVGLWTVACEGAIDTVAELRRAGYRLGVVSNAEGQVARDLDRAGFRGRFETIVDSCLVGVEKPDPAIFNIALERMALRAEGAVYLGDVPNVDVVGARAANLVPILLDRHGLYPDVQAPRLGSIRELPALLDQNSDA